MGNTLTIKALITATAGYSLNFFIIIIPRHTIVAGYYGFTLDVCLAICIDIKEIWCGIANGQISSNFYGVICLRHAHIFVSRQ